MLCAETPIKWAYKHGIIPSNPCLNLDKFNVENKKCGTFTEKEAAEILKLEYWQNNRAYVAALVSITSGARQGEVLAFVNRTLEK